MSRKGSIILCLLCFLASRKSILSDEPKMTGKLWDGISEEAKDFVRLCLIK